MANFKCCPKFKVFDDYYTHYGAWELISHLIPTGVIYEPFCLESYLSESGKHLQELTGNTVLYDYEWDFLEVGSAVVKSIKICGENPIIIGNPPYSLELKKKIFKKLLELDIPFILLMNANVIHSNYFNEIFKNHRQHLQLVIPNGKIHYEKLDKETNTKEILKRTAFYSLFVCYKMDIPNEKLYLDMNEKKQQEENRKKESKEEKSERIIEMEKKRDASHEQIQNYLKDKIKKDLKKNENTEEQEQEELQFELES